MLKIRLKKLGRKKKPFYRIILIDSRKKRDSKAINELGLYNPLSKKVQLNIMKIEEKIKEGAKLTKTVENLVKNIY
uniref:Small ribosomal subunit protein bS16c n=1 Tax=Polysiphonia sertularioides TaxID=945028 RepID=A0A1Z1M9Y5_9FLOR|nr:ribosomal protein S16 [Polysiphonia sertularioides]ARW62585.1 ribosomal protein S16 [Polysiphonia sertularioides]